MCSSRASLGKGVDASYLNPKVEIMLNTRIIVEIIEI